MLALLIYAGTIALLLLIARVAEWKAQDQHNDSYDRKHGGNK